MNFTEVKNQLVSCIESGSYDHEIRKNIDVKNLFQCGQMTDDYVIALIKKTRGNEHTVSPHHKAPEIDVHVFTPFKNGKRWYIKFYFIEPDAVFISVHESDI